MALHGVTPSQTKYTKEIHQAITYYFHGPLWDLHGPGKYTERMKNSCQVQRLLDLGGKTFTYAKKRKIQSAEREKAFSNGQAPLDPQNIHRDV